MEDILFELIAQINDKFAQEVEQVIAHDLGISYSDFLVLSELNKICGRSDSGKVKQDKIVKQVKYDKSTISRKLKKFEKKGLIRRKINKKSEREKLVSLTDQGVTHITSAKRHIATLKQAALARLDLYTQKQLQINLMAIVDSIGNLEA